MGQSSSVARSARGSQREESFSESYMGAEAADPLSSGYPTPIWCRSPFLGQNSRQKVETQMSALLPLYWSRDSLSPPCDKSHGLDPGKEAACRTRLKGQIRMNLFLQGVAERRDCVTPDERCHCLGLNSFSFLSWICGGWSACLDFGHHRTPLTPCKNKNRNKTAWFGLEGPCCNFIQVSLTFSDEPT